MSQSAQFTQWWISTSKAPCACSSFNLTSGVLGVLGVSPLVWDEETTQMVPNLSETWPWNFTKNKQKQQPLKFNKPRTTTPDSKRNVRMLTLSPSTVNIQDYYNSQPYGVFAALALNSLRGPGPRHDSPRWKDHLPCIANCDCSTPRTLFFECRNPKVPKKSPKSIGWWYFMYLSENMSGRMMRGFGWFLLHRLFWSWIPVFQDFLKW